MSTGEATPLTVTLPTDLAERVRAIAQRRQQTGEAIVCDACRRFLTELQGDDRDAQYVDGYRRVPENTSELEALLPHLPLPQESWS